MPIKPGPSTEEDVREVANMLRERLQISQPKKGSVKNKKQRQGYENYSYYDAENMANMYGIELGFDTN